MSLFAEIRRRKVFQVAAVYAVVAWLTIQIVDVVGEPLNLPEWFDTVTIVLLAVGFPIAVILAWAFDITPEGIKSASDTSPTTSFTPPSGQRLNYVTHALVLLAVGFLVVDQYLLNPNGGSFGTGTENSTVVTDSGPVRRFSVSLGRTEQIGNTGLSAHIALSPNSEHIAYAAQVEGRVQLYLRPLNEFTGRPLLGTEGAVHPFFAPDGERLAFYSDYSDYQLKTVSILGGQPQRLASTPWAPGGSWKLEETIVYSTQDDAGQRSIYEVSLDGSAPNVLIPSTNESSSTWPDVLPGGAILYAQRPIGGSAGNGSIAVFSSETKASKILIAGAFRPRYAPTGHIVFARAGSLWAVPFDSDRLETTGREVPVLEGVQTESVVGGAAFDFSNDGMLVYVPGGEVSAINELVWIDETGAQEELSEAPGTFYFPRLSPSGEFLAATVDESGNGDIIIYDLENDLSSQLTYDPGFDNNPVWTPDGEHIVFSANRDGANGLFRQPYDGTGPAVRLTESQFVQTPESISPDGSLLVFTEQRSESSDSYMLSLDDGEITPLDMGGRGVHGIRISPDGRWIAYESSDSGKYEIFVQPFQELDGGRWRVSDSGGHEPVWAADSSKLFYREESGAIFSVELNPGRSIPFGRPVFAFRVGQGATSEPSYDITPDGRFLTVTTADDGAQVDGPTLVRVVENWFQELERLAPPSD